MVSNLSDLVAPMGRSVFTLTAEHLNLILPVEALGEEGELNVVGAEGYVAYGPYSHLPAGTYAVEVDATGAAEAGPFARFEVFNGHAVLVAMDLSGPAAGEFHLATASSSLEFRLFAYGADFTFERFTITLRQTNHGTIAPAETPTTDTINRTLALAWTAIHSGADRAVFDTLGAEISRFEPSAVVRWAAERGWVEEIDASDEESLQRSTKAIRTAGLSSAALRLCRLDRFEDEAQIASTAGLADLSVTLGAFEPSAEATLPDYLNTMSLTHGVSQFTAAELGFVTCVCPFTGALLKSEHTLPIAIDGAKQSYLFHKFSSVQTFYLVICGFGGRKSFIYIPKLEIVIYVGAKMYNWGDPNYAIEKFRNLIICNLINVSAYFSRPTRRTILVNSIDNLGHYLWNDLSGLLRFQELRLLSQVEATLSYRFRFLDTAAIVGLDELETFAAASPEALFETTIRERLFLIRPTALIVQARWAAAVIAAAQRALRPAEREQIVAARKLDRLIFFNLRVHNKAWREQLDGAVGVAAEGVRRGLKVGLYLDGMPDCEELAEQISASLPAGAVAFRGFNKPMEATIAWAGACDGYVATIGSGLATLTWIAGLHGVAHSELSHLGQNAFWQDVRPDVPAPSVVDRDWVTDLGEGAYCNYSIDPSRIAKLFWALLDERRGARRPSMAPIITT